MRFEPDMTEVRAGFPVYDRGDYELMIIAVEGMDYMKETDDGDTYEVAGARFDFEMVGRIGPDGSIDKEGLEGEPASSDRFYLHTDKAWPFTKRFVMAAAGYHQDEEELFDEEFASDHTWHVDGEPTDPEAEVEVGSAYESVVGNRVHVQADKTRDQSGNEQQEWSGWTPAN